jgi:hypothetical protein
MSLSHEPTLDEELFVRYLLGQLSEKEAERVDELSLADDEVAWRLRAAEDDLVDAYVRGTLTEMMRARFERAYLVTPRRREKVRFAQSLVTTVDRAPVSALAGPATAVAAATAAAPIDVSDTVRTIVDVPASEAKPRWYERLFARPATGWTLTAVGATLAIVCGVLLVQATRTRQELTAAQALSASLERRAQDLQQQVDATRVAVADSSRELERVRNLLTDATQRTTTTPTPPSSPLAGAVALMLSPQTRSSGSMPSVALRPGADGVAFALLLESDDFTRYQVALKDPATNAIVWRSDRLAVGSINHSPTISVIVPARLLKAQHYALELSGIRTGGADVIGSYVVRIVQ